MDMYRGTNEVKDRELDRDRMIELVQRLIEEVARLRREVYDLRRRVRRGTD